MPFSLFIVMFTVVTPIIFWMLKNEDKLIDFEDEIFAKIKARFAKEDHEDDPTPERNLRVVENHNDEFTACERRYMREEVHYVA